MFAIRIRRASLWLSCCSSEQNSSKSWARYHDQLLGFCSENCNSENNSVLKNSKSTNENTLTILHAIYRNVKNN